MTERLCVTDLSAGYRGKPVLDRLNLQPLQPGTIIALVGPNAAGKSTLLRSLPGLHPATGQIRLRDLDLNRLSLAERGLTLDQPDLVVSEVCDHLLTHVPKFGGTIPTEGSFPSLGAIVISRLREAMQLFVWLHQRRWVLPSFRKQFPRI